MEHRGPNFSECTPYLGHSTLMVAPAWCICDREVVSVSQVGRVVDSKTGGQNQVNHWNEVELEAPVPDESNQIEIHQPHHTQHHERRAEIATEDEDNEEDGCQSRGEGNEELQVEAFVLLPGEENAAVDEARGDSRFWSDLSHAFHNEDCFLRTRRLYYSEGRSAWIYRDHLVPTYCKKHLGAYKAKSSLGCLKEKLHAVLDIGEFNNVSVLTVLRRAAHTIAATNIHKVKKGVEPGL